MDSRPLFKNPLSFFRLSNWLLTGCYPVDIMHAVTLKFCLELNVVWLDTRTWLNKVGSFETSANRYSGVH